jgi:hypothetical protein
MNTMQSMAMIRGYAFDYMYILFGHDPSVRIYHRRVSNVMVCMNPTRRKSKTTKLKKTQTTFVACCDGNALVETHRKVSL